MDLIKVTDGTPEKYTYRQFKMDNPHTSFPKEPNAGILSSYGVFPTADTEQPAHNADTQVCTKNVLPHYEDNRWAYGWTIRDKTAEELAADKERVFGEINAEREKRLAAGSAFTVEGIVDPIPLQGRPFDQTVYLALLTRAGGFKSAGVTTPVLTLRDAADTIHELTPDQMISLVSQAMTWFESVMAASWAMKDGTTPFEAGVPNDLTDDTHWPT